MTISERSTPPGPIPAEPATTPAPVSTAPAPVSTAPIAIAGAPLRLSWGAIIGGAVAALGVWALLYALGLALGLTVIDPGDPGSLRPTGIFTGIWSVVAPLVALFVGGVVAGRGAGAISRGSGAVHGLVMWGLSVVAGVWLVSNLASALVSGATSVGRTVTEAVGGVAGEVGRLPEVLGMTSEDVLAPVNRRLRAEGKPQITSKQLGAATRDVVRDAMRQGRLDRDLLVQSIASNTNLSRSDAREVASGMAARFDTAKKRVGQGLGDAQTVALQAAETTGHVFWGVFGALLLGMLAAMGGAAVGVSRRQRFWSTPQPPRVPESRFETPQTPVYG